MFTIKVAFKGKNILLGKGITSFDTIREELEARFSGQLPFGVIFTYKGEPLNKFEDIQALASNNKLTSVKIEATPVSNPVSKVTKSGEVVEKGKENLTNSEIKIEIKEEAAPAVQEVEEKKEEAPKGELIKIEEIHTESEIKKV